MMMSIALVPGLLVFIAGCFAACPDPTADSSLDINKIAGQWWGYKLAAEFQSLYKCGDVEFKPRDEDILDWKASEYDIPNSMWKYLRGSVHKVGEGKYEGFRVGFPGTVKFSVLGTDYNNWIVYWVCHETNERQWAFLMSRVKSLSPDAVESAEKVLPAGFYVITEQDDCPSLRYNSTYSYF